MFNNLSDILCLLIEEFIIFFFSKNISKLFIIEFLVEDKVNENTKSPYI